MKKSAFFKSLSNGDYEGVDWKGSFTDFDPSQPWTGIVLKEQVMVPAAAKTITTYNFKSQDVTDA